MQEINIWDKHEPNNSIWQLRRERPMPTLEFDAVKVTSLVQVCIQASHVKMVHTSFTAFRCSERLAVLYGLL